MSAQQPLNLPAIRHRLHQLAEPSGFEVNTQQFIIDILHQLKPNKIHTFDNSRNILVVFDAGNAGETLLFRGDFDAVFVDETLSLPYSSETPGVSHKCGHDGHTTILLGLAEQLSKKEFNGRILLFFQAAEETGEGASQLLETAILQQYKPDKVFALHNIPGEPLGTIICKQDSFTCSVISCDIELHGHTAHAAEPQKAVCPYATAKAITDNILALNHYNMEDEEFCLCTLVEFRIGEPAYGVAAGHGILRFTLRAKDDNVLQQTKQRVNDIIEEQTSLNKEITSSLRWKEYFAASKNDREAVTLIKNAAQKCGLTYKEKSLPFSWGEDFGLLTQKYDGALLGLGSGTDLAPLHHQHFDFPDELISIGVKFFGEMISKK